MNDQLQIFVFGLMMQIKCFQGNECASSIYMKIPYTRKQIDSSLTEFNIGSAYECLEFCRNHGTCKSVGINTNTMKCLLYDNRIYAGLAGTLSSDLIYYWLLEAECPIHLGYNENTTSKICTKYNSTKVTWDVAQRQCENDGGFLFILDTPDSQTIMREYAENAGSDRLIFIGATDKNEEDVWDWFNGVPINRSMFAYLEPNNFQDNEHCLVYYTIQFNLIDNFCNKAQGFVCQIPTEKSYIPSP